MNPEGVCRLPAMPTSTLAELNSLFEFSKGTLRSLLSYSDERFFVDVPNKQEGPSVAVQFLVV